MHSHLMHLAAVGSYAQNLGEGLDHTDDEADTDFFFFLMISKVWLV